MRKPLRTGGRAFDSLGTKRITGQLTAADCEVLVDANGQVKVSLKNIVVSGSPVQGTMTVVQSGGQLMGLRSYFGLAPVPAIGAYQFGGFANLSFLQPTAGREALSRESIELVTRLVNLAEYTASNELAETDYADRNTTFLQWLTNHKKWDLADRVTIRVSPDDKDVALGQLKTFVGKRTTQYYTGTDPHIIRTFSNEGACLVHIAQSQPRRAVQLHYVRERLGIAKVPDSVQVTRVYQSIELTAAEVSLLLRTAAILRDDYLIPDVDMQLVDMSHGVTVLPERVGEHQLRIKLARSSALPPRPVSR
jgi:molecular chaperone HtpG